MVPEVDGFSQRSHPVRFRSRISPRQQQLLRSGRRFTFAIAAVGIVLLVWLISRTQQSVVSPGSGSSPALLSTASIPGVLQSDEIQVVPHQASTADAAAVIDRAGAAAFEAGAAAGSADNSEDAPATLTQDVRDDVLGVLSGETEALFGTLKLAQKVFPQKYRQMPEASYPVVMTAPEACRGKPFLLRGRLRRLTAAPLPQSANSWGIRSAWDAWISTPDSGNQLVHVLALSADPGLPVTESTGRAAPEIELGGYFFKREGYAARGKDGTGDLALTPLFLTDRIRTIPAVVVVSRADELRPWLTWGAGLLCFTVVAIILAFNYSDKLFQRTRAHQLTLQSVRPEFENIVAVTVEQSLAAMEQNARQNADPSLLPLPPQRQPDTSDQSPPETSKQS